jgi:hypothetical protein
MANSAASPIDTGYYYQLTTLWQGDGRALDVVNDGVNNQLHLAAAGNFSGQRWKFRALGNGYFKVNCLWLGIAKSLDVVNDGRNNQLRMADSGDYSGQSWKLTPLDHDCFRLTTQWLGDGKALDVVNNGANDRLQLAETGDFSGQFWKLTRREPVAAFPSAGALAGVLGASAPSSTLGAVAQAVQFIDQQVAAIRFAQYSGFAGADQMSAATATMQAAASGWSATRLAVVSAAQLVAQNGPAAAQVGSGATTAGQIATALEAFRQGPLAQIVAAFNQARSSFDAFSSSLTQAYDAAANANQAAVAALQTARIQLQIAQGQLQADEDAANSAASIVATIFSFGIYGIVEIKKLEDEISSLNNQANQLNAQEQAYAASLGSFQNVLGAARQADYALDTVNTSLQQLGNAIDDITAQTSATLVVMQAYLKQFQTEFANAAANAGGLASA